MKSIFFLTVFVIILRSEHFVRTSEIDKNVKEKQDSVEDTNSDEKRSLRAIYTFIVALKHKTRSYFCEGSIIDPLWILTGARCVANKKIKNIEVHLGVTHLGSKPFGVVNISSYVIFPNYTRTKLWVNDIALIKLSNPLTFQPDKVEPVELPPAGFEVETKKSMNSTLVGWDIENFLRESNLTLYSDKDCEFLHWGRATKDQVCSGIAQNGRTYCKNNPGGPLLYSNRIQIGIFSYTIDPCGSSEYPDVFTKVSHYVEWIKSHINS